MRAITTHLEIARELVGAIAHGINSMLESHCWTWMTAGRDDVNHAYDEDTAIRTLAQRWHRAMVSAARIACRPVVES